MAKARSLPKPGRKAGSKPGKARHPAPEKRPVAKRLAKPVAKAASRQVVAAAPARRKAAISPALVAERVVELPETPPALPAPIASFTF